MPILSLARPATVRSATTRVAVVGVDPTALRRFAQQASRSEAAPDLTAVSSTVARTVAPATTTTTTARALTVIVASRRTPASTRRTVPRAPTTIVRPPATTRPPPPPRVQYGLATWLDSVPTGTCANNAAPMGAILTVTDTDTGRSVSCRVVSRGPYDPGRVVDLAEGTFAQLAPPSQGLVNVRVTW